MAPFPLTAWRRRSLNFSGDSSFTSSNQLSICLLNVASSSSYLMGPTRFLISLYKPLPYLLLSSSRSRSRSRSISWILSPIHCIFRFSEIWNWRLWRCFLQLWRFYRRLLPLRKGHWLRHRRRTKAARFPYRFPARLYAHRWSCPLPLFSGTRSTAPYSSLIWWLFVDLRYRRYLCRFTL